MLTRVVKLVFKCIAWLGMLVFVVAYSALGWLLHPVLGVIFAFIGVMACVDFIHTFELI